MYRIAMEIHSIYLNETKTKTKRSQEKQTNEIDVEGVRQRTQQTRDNTERQLDVKKK